MRIEHDPQRMVVTLVDDATGNAVSVTAKDFHEHEDYYMAYFTQVASTNSTATSSIAYNPNLYYTYDPRTLYDDPFRYTLENEKLYYKPPQAIQPPAKKKEPTNLDWLREQVSEICELAYA